MKIFFAILLISGCAAPIMTFELRDGMIVTCKEMMEYECGVYLGSCEDKEEYFCQHDLKTFRKKINLEKEVERELKKGTI